MVNAMPEHGPGGGLLQTFDPELSIVVTSTTPGPLAVPCVHEPVWATPLIQIPVRLGLGIRLARAALAGGRIEELAATYTSQPTSGSEFWTNTPTLKIGRTSSREREDILEG